MAGCSYVAIAVIGCCVLTAFADEVLMTCSADQNELSKFARQQITQLTTREPGKKVIVVNDTCIMFPETLITPFRISIAIKLLVVQFHVHFINLFEVNPATFARQRLDHVDIVDKGLSVSPERMMAFHPNFRDVDGSGLGAGFLHLRNIYPCIVPRRQGTVPPIPVVPRCSVHSYDQAGFNNGLPVLDIKINSGVPGFAPAGLPIFGFAVNTCRTFTTGDEDDGCLRGDYKFGVVCHLPGKLCGAEA